MSQTPNPDEKVCPFCAETIRAAAVKCRFCHSDLTAAQADPEPQPPPPASVATGAASAGAAPTGASPTGSAVRERQPATGKQPGDQPRAPFLSSFRLLGILVVLCLVLAGVAGFAWWRSEHPEDGAAPDGAITSTQARDAGMQTAAQLTEKVLSYDWKTLDDDMSAAQKLLAPSFRSEYAKAMNEVKAQTVKNQVELKASVVATSIVSATEQKVVALVFVNQVTTAKGTEYQRLDQNRVRVTLTRHGGDWRVSKMDAF
jgi:Mce-associated membrane protein